MSKDARTPDSFFGDEQFPLDEVLHTVKDIEQALIVLDVDNTISNGISADMEQFQARPGAADAIKFLVSCGHSVRLWSAGGRVHAGEVAVALDVDGDISGCHDKAPYPMSAHSVQSIFGRFPDLTIDDSLGEAVEGVPFVHVSTYWGDLM